MHRSRVAFWAMGIFIGGVGFADIFDVSPLLLRIFSGALAGLVALSFYKKQFILGAIILFAFLLGSLRSLEGPYSLSFLDPMRVRLESVRDIFVTNINHSLPEPHASYLAGLLVGARSTIPYEIKEAFRVTGTSHIIALSGYNVTIIAENLRVLSGSMGFSIAGIMLFVLATGASSSVVRAAIMGVLVLVAQRHRRDYNAKNALLFAAVLMIFINPPILLGNIGFQLSVVATAGLIFGVPVATRYLLWLPKKFGIREAASSTLAAQVATLPLVLYYFGRFSLLAPIVNVLVLITIPATMFVGFLAGVAGFFSSTLAQLFAWPTYLLLAYQLRIIQLFAHFGS